MGGSSSQEARRSEQEYEEETSGEGEEEERDEGRREGGREGRKAGGLDDAVFGQVAELHVSEGLPGADHGDVRAEALHAGDVVTEPGRRTERQCLTAASSHSFARLSIYTKIFF